MFTFTRNRPRVDMDRRSVYPGAGDLKFRCGKCGFTGFHVHVHPTDMNQARIAELVCASCQQVYSFDDTGLLKQGGTLEV